ncbi:MAG: hypothetical protein K2M27_10070 [Muribaculaceae bacterium]|nr:hypothetical protein [Muribaculaceae bacterium]
MKFTKILAACLAIFSMTACSDSEKYNSEGDVSVEMGQSEITVRENAGIFNVPVVLNGTTNGNVKVTVKVEATGANPALPFEERDGKWSGNYILTSETVNIPQGVSQVNLEFNTQDDFDENPDRTFSVTIVSAQGASIGELASTIVTLKDNDSLPYEKLQGAWKFNYFSGASDAMASWDVAMNGFEENTPEYGNLLTLDGLNGNPASSLDLDFHYILSSNETFVEMVLPEPIAMYNASNYVWVMKGEITPEGKVSLDRTQTVVRGNVSEDFKTITFDTEIGLAFVAASPDLSSIVGVMEVASDFSMSR